jgi:hypothetical protein
LGLATFLGLAAVDLTAFLGLVDDLANFLATFLGLAFWATLAWEEKWD